MLILFQAQEDEMNVNRFITPAADGGLFFRIPVDRLFTVRGDGLWSDQTMTRTVLVEEVSMSYMEDYNMWSDLRVHFNTEDWSVDQDGLIYTDSGFINDLRSFLEDSGIPIDIVRNIDYSEQGMQGDSYVSCDAYELSDWIMLQRAELA
jgi:hypothetical protein